MLNQPARKRPGLRQQKGEVTRLRIAREGLRLFSTEGYDKTTLEGVALAAGISARTLYHYVATGLIKC
ncbi:TetR/AcrR family transcriptional regulator [uncultured Enterovirga sp.]|uniref:TetR/AcrR family transcriptional regulator n=1 Tax=uncultured Enterovirga sp. TaxID=2026352 RepID=UPI0035CBBD3B